MTDLTLTTVVKTHQCCCVNIDAAGVEHQCVQQVEGSDSPFCFYCEDRHPDVADYNITVSARLPSRQA